MVNSTYSSIVEPLTSNQMTTGAVPATCSKRCGTCNKNRLLKFFRSNKTKTDGLQSNCIDCHREYRKQHYILNKQKYIDKAHKWNKEFRVWWKEYKKQFKCTNCSENHPGCIHFHHINPSEKSCNISSLISRGSKKLILAELKKCIPLCANCHLKLHWYE